MTQECVRNCSFIDIIKNRCKLNYKNNSNYKNYEEELLNNFRNMITGVLNASTFNNNEELYLKEKDVTYSFASSKDNDIKENDNRTIINLGLCEDKLKDIYNISKNNSLYILKLDIFFEGMKIPKLEYEVYYPLNNTNFVLLDLSLCEDIKIEKTYPLKIEEDKIDQYDSKSEYYNDICYPAASESGTDISLLDRREEFIDNNMTVCEEECDLKTYDEKAEKVTCSCQVKIKIGSFSEIKFDKLKLYRKFTNLNYISNINVMKCSHLVFSKGLVKNMGFYLIMIIILIGLILLVIFYFKEFNIIKDKINRIILDKKFEKNKISSLDDIKIENIEINQINHVKPQSKKK